MASTNDSVNMILFQLGSKNTADVHISNGTSEMIPNSKRVPKYFHLFLVWKYPSIKKNINIGKAILPKLSNRSLILLNNPPSRLG